MNLELSPQSEQYLASAVASGFFPSTAAALEAAVDALREKTHPLALVPEEHAALVDEGIASARAGRKRELVDSDWENLRQMARAAAMDKPAGKA